MRTRSRYCAFIFGVIWLRTIDADYAENITTASKPQPSSARPTTVLKILQVQMDDKQSTADLFGNKLFSGRRSSHTHLWSWDFWCQLQPKIGKCNENITKYYYDAQLDQCLRFQYSGCEGNENQFETRVDCERHCNGAVYMPIKQYEYEDSRCTLQPNAGRCFDIYPMFYYDVNTEECRPFGYGGCGGNRNMFLTDDECIKECQRSDHGSGHANKHKVSSGDSTSSAADENVNSDGA